AWQRKFAWYPGDWIWPTLLFLALTIVSTAVALAANAARQDSRPHTIAATLPSISVGPGATPTNVPVSTSASTLPVGTNQPTITTGPLPTAPGSGTGRTPTTTTPATNPNALASWPADKSGYTLV